MSHLLIHVLTNLRNPLHDAFNIGVGHNVATSKDDAKEVWPVVDGLEANQRIATFLHFILNQGCDLVNFVTLTLSGCLPTEGTELLGHIPKANIGARWLVDELPASARVLANGFGHPLRGAKQ